MKNRYWSIVKRVMAGLMAAALLLASGRAHVANSDQSEVQVCDDELELTIYRG